MPRIITEEKLQELIKRKANIWIGENYGTQEVDDPCYNIDDLSRFLAKRVFTYIEQSLITEGEPKKNYELTVLLKPDLEVTPLLNDIQNKIEGFGGEVKSMTDEGRKRLAYSINDNDYANYIYIDLRIAPSNASKLSSYLNVKSGVLRYLLVYRDNN